MTIFIWASQQKGGMGIRRTGLDTLQTAMTTRALVVLRMTASAIFRICNEKYREESSAE